MSFFPPPAERPADTRDPNRELPPRWMGPPEAELPERLPMSAILLRNADVAVVLCDIEVYADGCNFRLEWMLRRGDRNDSDWQEAMGRFQGGHWGSPLRDPATVLRFGLELADGQQLVNADGQRPWDIDRAEPLPGNSFRFREEGGSGSDDFVTQHGGMWLWPLPPMGNLTIVSEWAAFDIPQSTFQVDAALIRAAAARARPLWD